MLGDAEKISAGAGVMRTEGHKLHRTDFDKAMALFEIYAWWVFLLSGSAGECRVDADWGRDSRTGFTLTARVLCPIALKKSRFRW